jgi:transposase
MPGNYLSTPDKEKIVKARKEGISRAAVASLFGCSRRTVSRIVSEVKTSGNVHRSEKKGRPRITTKKEDRMLVRAFKKNPNMASTEGTQLVKRDMNKDISRWTASRRLIQAGLFSRRPARKPWMTASHRKQRLQFARTYQSWTVEDWSKVIFVDETKVNLFFPNGNHLVRRPIGKRLLLKYLRPAMQAGGGSIMCFGKDHFYYMHFI